MAANCAQLRQSLAHLQSQLNVLTTNKNGPKEEPPKQEKPKKSKSKKKAVKQAQKNEHEKVEAPKGSESDEATATKENLSENEPCVSETVVSNEVQKESESPEEKIDDKTMESLIQAINLANINLSDLEVVNSGQSDKLSAENSVEAIEELIGLSNKVPVIDPGVVEGPKSVDTELADKSSQILESNPNELEEVSHIVEEKPISTEVP